MAIAYQPTYSELIHQTLKVNFSDYFLLKVSSPPPPPRSLTTVRDLLYCKCMNKVALHGYICIVDKYIIIMFKG